MRPNPRPLAQEPPKNRNHPPKASRHRLACACLCALAFASWLLTAGGLASLVLAACTGPGRQAAYESAGVPEPEIVGDSNAFVACAREFKLRWSTLMMHVGVWCACAWAVVVARVRSRDDDEDNDHDEEAPPSPPPPRLWPPAPPPAPPPPSSPPLRPQPSSFHVFTARAAALSPLLCACLCLAALCADADLNSGTTTAPGVMEWWYSFARGQKPLTSLQERKYAAVQASAAGWILLAACDAAWAVAGVVFASSSSWAAAAGGAGAGRGGRKSARLLRRQQQQQQQASSSSSGNALVRVEIAPGGP